MQEKCQSRLLRIEHVKPEYDRLFMQPCQQKGGFSAGKVELQPNFNLKIKLLNEKVVLSLTVRGPAPTCRV